jgi:outer membrane immunogenic protein
MSKIRILGVGAIALIIGAGGATAADLTYSAPPAEVIYTTAPAFSWTGPYIGGLLGYGWGDAKVKNGPSVDPDGWVAGVYLGYNWAYASGFVAGLETDIAASGMGNKNQGVTVDNTWNGTLRARAGFAFNRFLIYGTGGLAYGGIEVKNGGKSDSSTPLGWTIGAGMEAAFTDNVIGRLEYRYTDLGSDTYSTNPKTNVDFQSSQVFAGVALKF